MGSPDVVLTIWFARGFFIEIVIHFSSCAPGAHRSGWAIDQVQCSLIRVVHQLFRQRQLACMQVTHLDRKAFGGMVELYGLCCAPSGELFAAGHVSPGPSFGDPLQIDANGAHKRLVAGLTNSASIAFDNTTGAIIIAGNDGTTPNRPRVPNGIFRLDRDGSKSVITRIETGSGPLPVAVDDAGNIFYPAYLPDEIGQSVVCCDAAGCIRCVASEFLQISGLAVDRQGNIFVADAESTEDDGVLLIVDRDKNKSARVLFRYEGLRPCAVACGKDGAIYFSCMQTERNGGCVLKRISDGSFVVVADGLSRSAAITYDLTNDRLYALDFLNPKDQESDISMECRSDSLVLRLTADGELVPAPYFHSLSLASRENIQKFRVPLHNQESSKAANEDDVIGQRDNVGRAEQHETAVPSGPMDLVKALLDEKQYFEKRGLRRAPLLSDGAVERLITLAYHASCLEEEGHFPRFRIIAGYPYTSRHAVHFGPFPRYLKDVKALRKLAPAAGFRGSAIVFGETWNAGEHAELICRGIYDTETLVFDDRMIFSNSLEDDPFLKSYFLVIRVEGPAFLKASYVPGSIYSLRGGNLRRLQTVASVPSVESLFLDLGAWLHSQLPTDDKRVQFFFENANVFTRLMLSIWSRILWHVSDRRHGGTFIVLPVSKGHWRHSKQFDIAVSYRSDFSFGKAILGCVHACLETTPADGQGYGDFFQTQWFRLRSERERHTRMLADLANVDGCVVLDRQLNVLGFGGKIEVPVAKMDGFGTRHGSAKAWCEKFPGGIAFVISQDGNLRVISHELAGIEERDAGTSLLELC